MGVVYKVRQAGLNRIVALKMIRSGELADDEQVKRFYVEAEAAAKLDHPNIVPVYEVGEQNGQHFFSMAFVDGTDLHDRVKDDGPLAPKDAASIMMIVAEAVQVAHAQGIVHRDIKPKNILVDVSNQPRVTDFGLAKDVSADSGMTATGQIMGTPSFMTPEQATGKNNAIGPVTDVYSLGATLYYLLTGRPPFQAASAMETMRQVLDHEPVSPRQLNNAVSADLETICLKCLEKEPKKRYPSAERLADELRRYLKGEAIAAWPISKLARTWRWCRRNPLVAGLSTAVVLVLFAGVVVSVYLAVWGRVLSTGT